MMFILGLITGLLISIMLIIFEAFITKKTGKTITQNIYRSASSRVSSSGSFVGAKTVEEEIEEIL